MNILVLNGNCVQKDDMQEIYPMMRESESRWKPAKIGSNTE